MTGKSKPWGPSAGRVTSASVADVAALTRRQQPALAIVPRDPICTLRFRGTDHDAIDLPTERQRFIIGSAPTCDVVVPREMAEAVSGCHAAMERTGTGFVVRDLASKNGTYGSLGEARRESVDVEPGDTFWVANVGVTVTDGTLDVLRAHVLCHVGLDDVAAVDQAMDDIASGTPLMLRGPAGTGARRLARYIHATSPYLDLTDLPALPARYAARLLDPASGLRVIFAATDERRARACLDHLRDRVRTVALVPLARRREEAPYLMQLYWATALRSTRRVDELGVGKVRFEPFLGVGPRRFLDLFSTRIGDGYPLKRKENGALSSWTKDQAAARVPMSPTSYLERERQVARIVPTLLAQPDPAP